MEHPSSLTRLPLEDNGTTPAPPTDSIDGPKRRRPGLPWLLAPMLMAAGGFVGMYFQPPGLKAVFAASELEPGAGTGDPMAVAPREDRDDNRASVTGDVVALGRLVPQGDIVAIAPPFGAGDARIARFLAREGQHLAAGEVIAELDSLPILSAAAATAEASVEAQSSALALARANATASQREASAELARAEAAATLANAQAQRQRSLFERQLIARSSLEEAETNAIVAARELDRARVQLARHAGGEAQPDVALAARQWEVARQNLEMARAELSKAFVVAPFDGTVIRLRSRAGERVGSEGIATFGNLQAMEAELEVYQSDIERVRQGLAVEMFSVALRRPLRGRISSIGLEVERQSVLSANPAANTDARVVRVRVAIEPEDRERAAALSGLEVTARIRATP